MDPPETQYARSGDVSIAYQVLGDGPFDVVHVPGFVTHLELAWRTSFASTMEMLASFCRFIRFDKRGTGMSDRVSGAPTLEERMDDARTVMDAAGSRRAALFGSSEGAAMSILFAATYPERTAALVLRSAYPRAMWAPDYPWGWTEESYRESVARDLRLFDSRDRALEAVRARIAVRDDDEARQWLDNFRWSASPGAVAALAAMNREIDVRPVLAAIRVPTLVLHGTEDTLVPLELARYVTERIPTARLVEFPGVGHLAAGPSTEPMVREVERFLTEVWESGGWEDAEPDRVLATILFTDLVGSTAKAAELGDRGWRELLARHHERIRGQLARFRGVELDTAGDGFFARFDGPARAIRCACEIRRAVDELGIEVRMGLHTGECELLDDKVAGIAVSIGARVAAQARPGEVLVSQTVKDLVAGSGIEVDNRGVAALKGVPGKWGLYAVADS